MEKPESDILFPTPQPWFKLEVVRSFRRNLLVWVLLRRETWWPGEKDQTTAKKIKQQQIFSFISRTRWTQQQRNEPSSAETTYL